MYLQDPFRRNIYVEASTANDLFAIQRQRVFVKLCQLLGARSLEVKTVHVTKQEASREVDVGGGRGVEAKVQYAASTDDQLVQTLRTVNVFHGGVPDLRMALQLLEDSHLEDDHEFRSLVDLMDGPNPLREREYELTVTRSGQQQLSLAASLKVPAYARLSIDYASKLRTRTEYKVRLRIAFGRES